MTHAIVIGGSIGGLLAAKALAPHVDRVTVIDRDTPPDVPVPRKGAGQGTQVHALLDSGRRAIEHLLPGFFKDLVQAGGICTDFGEGVRWYHAGSYKLQTHMGLQAYVQSRPFLEHHIRRRVCAAPGIDVKYGVRCRGLTASQGRITGANVQASDGTSSHLQADIVIVATGRGKQPEKWLSALDIPSPHKEIIPIGIGYASRMYDSLPDIDEEHPIMLCYASRSRSGRQGLAFRTEAGHVLVTAMGYHGDHAPADPDGWLEWMQGLERPDIAKNLAHATPLSKVMSFRTPEQIRTHWHKARLPEGLALIGDAACALDPVFGQGMSVAAVQALGLSNLLMRGPFSTRRVQRMVFRKSWRAWFITSAEAARFPASRPHVKLPLPGVLHWFLDRVFSASAHDLTVYRAFSQVLFLNKGASHLFRPDLLWRILRPGKPAPEPRPLLAEQEVSEVA